MHSKPWFFSIAWFALAGPLPLHASVFASASTTGPCSQSQSSTAPAFVAVAVSCFGFPPGASTSVNFNAALPSLATLDFLDMATPSGGSNSSSSLDYTFVITGGTGAGFLALDAITNLGGFKDTGVIDFASYEAVLNGSSIAAGGCARPIDFFGVFGCSNTVPIGFGFTYNTPFEFRFDLSGVAGTGGLAGSYIQGTVTFSYAILSGGVPNPNGELSVIPEPSALGICALALAVGIVGFFRTDRRSHRN